MDKRLGIVIFTFALALGGAAGRAFYMQVIKHEEFAGRSTSNYLRRVPLPAIRGRILDRNGAVLAGWRPMFVGVALLGGKKGLSDRELRSLKRALRKDSLRVKPSYLGYTVVAKDIEPENALAVMERTEKFGWFLVLPWFARTYPEVAPFAHILGYVEPEGRGKAGLEKSWDSLLAGTPGTKYLMVDANGKVVENDVIPPEEPVAGEDITLTVDGRLQRAADSLFWRYERGAAVVMNIKTGEILVLYSKPYVDPNTMVWGTPEEKARALEAQGSPLMNRAVSGLYPPGSTFKPGVALAALASRAIDENTIFCCGGGVRFGRRFFRCTGVHGCLTVVHAIEHSCNSFFYNVGIRMGLEGLLEALGRLDFLGRRYDLGLGGEKKGLVPTMGYYMKRYGQLFPGTALNIAIGQGEILLTPLHMALLAGLVARGEVPYPHLVLKEGKRAWVPPETLRLDVPETDREMVKEGMLLVVESGTARSCRLPGFRFGGKTGTAENPHGRDHSLFIFFAPYDDPEIAGAVVVEQGGYGSTAAAPLARELIRRYFGLPPAPLFVVRRDTSASPEEDTLLQGGEE